MKGLKAYASRKTGVYGDDNLQATMPMINGYSAMTVMTTLRPANGKIMFVGGAGNDIIHSQGGSNTFLFSGDFGQDQIYGYQAQDKLVFMGTPMAAARAVIPRFRV